MEEVDCILEQATTITPVEIKASKTPSRDLIDNLTYFASIAQNAASTGMLIYGGTQEHLHGTVRMIPWDKAGSLIYTMQV